MEKRKPIIYAVSDATGELAISVAVAALRQFQQQGVSVLRRSKVQSLERAAKIIREAQETGGLVVYTFVAEDLRLGFQRLVAEAKLDAVDVMGPVMAIFSRYLETAPSDQPGLQYKITSDYFRRNEAIEFTVKHDDGQGLETLDQADIVLLGISRTSKTPLSIYLAYRGFKVANVPLIKSVAVPPVVRTLSHRKIVGLTISPEKLSELRGARLIRLGLSPTESYADIEVIREELLFAKRLFSDLEDIPIIDVTMKAIEEVATEILTVLGL